MADKFCGESFRYPTTDETILVTGCRRPPGHEGRHAHIGFTELVGDYVARTKRGRGKPRWRVMAESTPRS